MLHGKHTQKTSKKCYQTNPKRFQKRIGNKRFRRQERQPAGVSPCIGSSHTQPHESHDYSSHIKGSTWHTKVHISKLQTYGLHTFSLAANFLSTILGKIQAIPKWTEHQVPISKILLKNRLSAIQNNGCRLLPYMNLADLQQLHR